MGKGKKFDAAEVHFQKLVDREKKENKRLTLRVSELHTENVELKKENEILKNKIDSLEALVKELMELKDLSQEDIRELVDKAKSMNTAMNMIGVLSSNGFGKF